MTNEKGMIYYKQEIRNGKSLTTPERKTAMKKNLNRKSLKKGERELGYKPRKMLQREVIS